MRRLLLGVAVFAVVAGFMSLPAAAQGEVILELPIDTVARGDAGTEALLATVAISPEDVGRVCTVVVAGENNTSVHPDTDLIVRSGQTMVVAEDVERAPGAITEAEGELTLASQITVSVRFGPDEVFSGGLVLTLECEIPPVGGVCVETVNPHGKNVPPAGSTTLPGPKGGQNDDGFYQIGSATGAEVFVIDTGSGTVFGPYPSGTNVKYTEANGATPSEKKIGSTNGQAGAVLVHIQGTGDMGVATSPTGTPTLCFVPPPPK
jgi:hypothetical protein